MPHLALSAIGRDRPGIVAAISKVLLDHRCNVEDSTMSILRGHFTMMLIVSAPESTDLQDLRAELDDVRAGLSLEGVSVSEVAEVADETAVASHILTVYGADHPGILHSVTAALAADQVDIVDLTTRVSGEERNPLYAMILEVAVPDGVDLDALQTELGRVCHEERVFFSLNELERDIL